MSQIVPLRIRNLKLREISPVDVPAKKFRFITGGRFSGKSWGVIIILVSLATVVKDLFIVCGREFQNSIEESIYKLIVDTIRRSGLEDDFTILRDEIRHKRTRARFVFLGLRNNPEAIKGLESAHILYIDEADRTSLETWRIAIPTMRAPGWTIIAAWNPQNPSDPVEQIWRENSWRGVRTHTTYLDNPDVDQSKIDEAERMKQDDPELYAHIYLGHYKPVADNAVIPLRTLLAAQDRPKVLTPSMPRIAALDPALFGGDKTGWVVRQGDAILEVDEAPVMDAPDLERWTATKCVASHVDMLVVDSDGIGGPIAQHLAKDYPGLKVLQHNGGIKLKGPYANWRAQSWFELGKSMSSGLWVPKIHGLSDELQRQTFHLNKDGQQQLTSKEDMRKKGIPSPNLGDAAAMTYSPAISQQKTVKLTDDFGQGDETW